MKEQEYRDKFEIREEEVQEVWPIIQSVFKVPSVDGRYKTEHWPLFPAQIFQESCELALLGEDFFATEYLFNKFRDFLVGVDEDYFIVLVLVGFSEELSYSLRSYPTRVNWNVLSADNRAAALIEALFAYDHYVIGGSGQWGMYYEEAWDVYVLGYKDREVLEALQSTYDFEGRGAEVIEPLPKEREARRLHEIADQIRAEEEGGTPS
jgi:hypothetical protein